jgi:hypothetical protein
VELIAWSYDIAREQSPSLERLRGLAGRSRAAGYNALGLYLEHRFAYPSAPWAAGPGCVDRNTIRALLETARPLGLRVIPFLNTLGHMEGFIRAAGGEWLAEGPAPGHLSLQMCPTRPECREFARRLVSDALQCFDDEWIHLGGDETRQLGQCAQCAARARLLGLGGLYGEYFGALCKWVLEQGRRPCLWADMVLKHPEALHEIPRDTVLFDWQYTTRPLPTTQRLRAAGFDVVCCPSLRTYDSGWCFWPESRTNIDEHAQDAPQTGALGVCLTSWEFAFFSQFDAALPLVLAAGRRLARSEDWNAALAAEGGAPYARAAAILGSDVPRASAFLATGTWRNLRDRLVTRQDPFLLWRDWRADACGPPGNRILELCDAAARGLPANEPLHGAIELHRSAVGWVRDVEQAAGAYRARDTRAAVAALEAGEARLARLAPALESAAACGGSAADVQRLGGLRSAVRRVRATLEKLPSASGYRPAFETVIHPAYILDDQAAWITGLHAAGPASVTDS